MYSNPRRPVACSSLREMLQPAHAFVHVFAHHVAPETLVDRGDVLKQVLVAVTGQQKTVGTECSGDQSKMGRDSRVSTLSMTEPQDAEGT